MKRCEGTGFPPRRLTSTWWTGICMRCSRDWWLSPDGFHLAAHAIPENDVPVQLTLGGAA